tara:strand:+ start:465 stop:1325 length:861 start_codon:yes stop_codon:yes gene_type:complete
MKKVLVTGGNGYLGSEIMNCLIDKEFFASSFDIKPKENNINQFIGDLKKVEDVENAVSGHEIVFHLGGFSDLNQALTRPIRTINENILGTINILNACKKFGVKKLIFASTIYVYSKKGGYYRISKQACESYIEEFGLQNNLNYTILRYGSIYGSNSSENNGVHKLLKMAIDDGVINYSGDSNDRREYIHVTDAANLSVKAIDKKYDKQRIIISGVNSLKASELFKLFEELLDKEIIVRYHDGVDNNHYQISPYNYNPKLGKKLTSNLSIDMGQGILDLIGKIKENS